MIKELRSTDPTSVGPYRVLGRLGAGGMGQVYLARSEGNRLVAVKVIRSELAEERGFRARFASEVAAARNVGGLYTAAVVDSDPEAELPWMATAYVPGPSLAEAVHDGGPLPANTVTALAAGLAEALGAIHRAGVVHRDLKPSNVLLAADGPRVIDFGISQSTGRSVITETGAVLGSPGFMSPEQARGQRGIGPPADIFSLGAVLAFAATGIGPFGSGGTPVLLYRVVNEEPHLAQVPARLRPLIARCLAKDPMTRPAAAEVLELLGDETEPPTGEWLPKTVADAIGRFNSATEDPAPSLPGTASRNRRRRTLRTAGGGRHVQSSANEGKRWHAWRLPAGATATAAGAAVLVAIFAASPGGSPSRPTPSTVGTTTRPAVARPATASSPATTGAPRKKKPASGPARVNLFTAPASSAYASASLVTGSSSVTAWVYFGQLKAVVDASAGQVTYNTPVTWLHDEPDRCVLTVVFKGVTAPTGAVYAHGLNYSDWQAVEYAPSQTTEKGNLHQQLVTPPPPQTLSAGESWRYSAELVAGSQQLTSTTYSLKFQGAAGLQQRWLVNGQAVGCDA